MTTANQRTSVEEIEQIVAQRVANAIEAIAIYESINQTKQRENKVAGNASNKRKWEEKYGNCKRRGHQVRDCRYPVPKAKHRSVVSGKKAEVICYGYGEKCGNCKQRGHQVRDCRIPVLKAKQRSVVSGKKAEVICYAYGGLGHYTSNCPILKFQKRVDKYWKGKAHVDSCATTSNINI
nr:hypothetical protein [Tanacetum cinerariifolium]